jgi:hypothetical protein
MDNGKDKGVSPERQIVAAIRSLNGKSASFGQLRWFIVTDRDLSRALGALSVRDYLSLLVDRGCIKETPEGRYSL